MQIDKRYYDHKDNNKKNMIQNEKHQTYFVEKKQIDLNDD